MKCTAPWSYLGGQFISITLQSYSILFIIPMLRPILFGQCHDHLNCLVYICVHCTSNVSIFKTHLKYCGIVHPIEGFDFESACHQMAYAETTSRSVCFTYFTRNSDLLRNQIYLADDKSRIFFMCASSRSHFPFFVHRNKSTCKYSHHRHKPNRIAPESVVILPIVDVDLRANSVC